MLIASSNCSVASRAASAASLAPADRPDQPIPLVFDDDGALECRAVGAHGRQQGHVVGGAEPAREDQQPHARLLERMAQLHGLVGGIDVHQDGADARGRVLRDDPLEPIRRPDADAIARLDADGQECPRDLGRLAPQLPIGGAVALRADHERVVIGHTLHRARQIRADGLAEQRYSAGAVQVRQHGPARRTIL